MPAARLLINLLGLLANYWKAKMSYSRYRNIPQLFGSKRDIDLSKYYYTILYLKSVPNIGLMVFVYLFVF